MDNNYILPIELYQEILERSDFITQIRLYQLNNYFHENLKLNDFYTHKYVYKLNDDILKRYKHIKYLKANPPITDNGIQHLQLHTLDTPFNKRITDNGL